MFNKNKRGMEDKLYFVIWELIAIGMVTVILVLAVRGIAQNSSYWKKYYSTDLGLMADIANINQGDFVVNYQLKKSADLPSAKPPEIVLTPTRVEVYDAPKEESKVPYTWPYARSRSVESVNSSTIAELIVMSKIDTIFRIDTSAPTDAMTCPAFDTAQALDAKTAFNIITVDDQTRPAATALESIMKTKGYGSDPGAKTLTTFILATSHTDSVLIIYPADTHMSIAGKMSCLIAQEFNGANGPHARTVTYVPDQNDNNQTALDAAQQQVIDTYTAAVSSDPQRSGEFWVLVALPNNPAIDPGTVAKSISTALEKYYIAP